MNESSPGDRIGFTLTELAQEYLSKTLPDWIKQTSEQRLVPTLSFSGGGRAERNGKVTWEYRGALFLLGGQRRGALQKGGYFDLLRFPVWIAEIDQLLLRGRTLTFAAVGMPEPRKYLVIENAPENFFETVLRENSKCRLRNFGLDRS